MKWLKGYDYTLIITPIVLAAFGIVMIYSASMVQAIAEGFSSTHYFDRQLKWFILGLVGFVVCSLLPYKYYWNLSNLIIVISSILLISVLLFGEEFNYAVRSIKVFGFYFQPSEFVKLGVIIFLAKAFSQKRLYAGTFFQSVILPLLILLGLVAFIIKQPDIGTSIIILLISISIVLSSGLRMRHLLFLGTIFTMSVIAIIPFMYSEKRLSRITGAYNPFLDPDGSGQHLIQSYLAIGGGGLSGEGLGQSIQKLGFLWGAHNDFIMAVIAEELGVIGVIIVIGLLATIVLRGLYISIKCVDSFGALLALGISSMIGFQAFINMGAISGLLPITGVPLPFISYGGSSLFVLMLSMGILNNIAKSVRKEEEKPTLKETVPVTDYTNRRGISWSN